MKEVACPFQLPRGPWVTEPQPVGVGPIRTTAPQPISLLLHTGLASVSRTSSVRGKGADPVGCLAPRGGPAGVVGTPLGQEGPVTLDGGQGDEGQQQGGGEASRLSQGAWVRLR